MNNSNIYLVLAFDHPTRAVESVGIRMAAGLATLGFNVVTLSLPRDNAQLAQYAPSQVSGVLMLGPVPLSARPGGMKLWERFNCPISLFTLDAIIYDLARGRAREVVDYLIAARTDRRLGLVSPETGYRDWLGQALAITWDHMPFAAFPCVQIGPVETGEFGPDPVQLPSPGQQRVAVIGTIGSELVGSPRGETLPALLARVAGPVATAAQRQNLCDALLAPDAHNMPAVTVARTMNWGAERVFEAPSLALMVAIDSWFKRERRIQAISSLVGVPVDFYGTGWREQFGETQGFRYIGRVHHDHIAHVLSRYRATVNFDPCWQGGVHDRVYSAAAMGTHVFTNRNAGLERARLPADLITTYDANRPRLAELVRDSGVLEAPPSTGARADVLAHHNWGSRMAEWLCTGQAPQPLV